MEDDFSSVCATAAEPAKRRRLDGDGGGPCGVEGESEGEYTEQQQHEDEQDTYSKENGCTICFENMTVSGAHRIVSLLCGHLFGHQCIDKWLSKKNACPQCARKAVKKDIRPIYARNIVATDNKSLDDAKNRAISSERERDHWRLIAESRQTQLDSLVDANMVLKLQNDRLSKEVATLQALCKFARTSSSVAATATTLKAPTIVSGSPHASQSALSQPTHPAGVVLGGGGGGGGGGVLSAAASASAQEMQSPPTPTFTQQMERLLTFRHKISFHLERGARAFDFERSRRCVVASKTLTNGCGALVKISMNDSRSFSSLEVHTKQIRDVQCGRHRADGYVASAALDKTVAISSLDGNTRIQLWTLDAPAWSCCWDDFNQNLLYAGLVNGSVVTLDLRQSKGYVNSTKIGDGKGIHSLQSLRLTNSTDGASTNALAVGTLGNVYIHNPSTQETSPGVIPFGSGQCISSYYDNDSGSVLASFRQNEGSSHSLLGVDGDLRSLYSINQFAVPSTHKHMFRTDLFSKALPKNERRLFVAAPDDASAAVKFYDPTSPQSVHRLPLPFVSATEPMPTITQIKHASMSTGEFLGVLSESQLWLFKSDM